MARIQSAEEFTRAAGLKTGEAEVGGGNTVRIRELNVDERADFTKAVAAGESRKIAAQVVAWAAIDDAGRPIFPDPAALLTAITPERVEGVATEVLRLSGLLPGKSDPGEA